MPSEGPRSSSKHLTAEDKQRILALANEGVDTVSVARTLGLNGRAVNGFLSTARKLGTAPPPPPPLYAAPQPVPMPMPEIPVPMPEPAVTTPIPEETPPMLQPNPFPAAAPQPAPIIAPAAWARPVLQQPAPTPSAAVQDGFSGGRPIVGGSGGFTGQSNQIRWTVERMVPPDGLLGTHYGSFTPEELGQTYGEGTYKITKNEPGRPVAMEYIQKIGPSYGHARQPSMSPDRARLFGRSPYFGRPWDRAQDPLHTDGSDQTQGPRYAYPRDPYGDRTLYEFSRNSATGDGAVGKAIDMLGAMHQRSLEQVEVARRSGPESYVTRFLEAQQEIWNRRWEEERRRDEERRGVEEGKWERRQQEERDRWERERQASREAHDHDLARIKAESDARLKETQERETQRREADDRQQKSLLELEDRKLKLIQEGSKLDRDRMEGEISRSREEMKSLQEKTSEELRETRETTQKAIEENHAEVKERMDRDREGLEREYKLRERSLDKEHELSKQVLDVRSEMLQQQSGDQIFNIINTVVKEFAKGLERIVDLKKLEAMTPEAQAAAAARGAIDGNVIGGPAGEPQPEAPAVQPQRQGAAAAQKPPGNGHTEAKEGGGTDKMESFVREGLKRQEFQEIIKEWALHVQEENDPSAFANLYLEMMQDQKNEEIRKFCTMLLTLMSVRNWAKMFAFMQPHLDADTVRIFQTPWASKFYEAFRAMVTTQVRHYWNQFLTAKKADQEQPSQAAPARVPVEPAGAAGAPTPAPAPADGVPVPTRESLRQAL
jgi:hypothetical protein